jgi:hypothetical protein
MSTWMNFQRDVQQKSTPGCMYTTAPCAEGSINILRNSAIVARVEFPPANDAPVPKKADVLHPLHQVWNMLNTPGEERQLLIGQIEALFGQLDRERRKPVPQLYLTQATWLAPKDITSYEDLITNLEDYLRA